MRCEINIKPQTMNTPASVVNGETDAYVVFCTTGGVGSGMTAVTGTVPVISVGRVEGMMVV